MKNIFETFPPPLIQLKKIENAKLRESAHFAEGENDWEVFVLSEFNTFNNQSYKQKVVIKRDENNRQIELSRTNDPNENDWITAIEDAKYEDIDGNPISTYPGFLHEQERYNTYNTCH